MRQARHALTEARDAIRAFAGKAPLEERAGRMVESGNDARRTP